MSGEAVGADVPLMGNHPEGDRRKCPIDGSDLMRVGITGLAYTFELCNCLAADYTHLVEQMWHRACFIRSGEIGPAS